VTATVTARDSAHKAARTLLRVRSIVVAGYAASAAAACTGVLALCLSNGFSASSPAAIGGAAAVILLWAWPAVYLYRSQTHPHRTVSLADGAAPELELLVRQLSLQLQVPAPSGIELSPGCDAWLDPRPTGAVLVIGSPFLWWLRVSELRGLLAPLVAGMAAVGDDRISRARRFSTQFSEALRAWPGRWIAPAWRSRLTEYCEARAELLERAVALEAVASARLIEPAARASAHEQINLAAAGWDRVLTRLAQPAWESGFCPIGLNVALVGALTALGRRDRMAGGLTARLGERPACDLLEEPGRVDAEVSRIAAEVFDGRRIERTVTWDRYLADITEPESRRRADLLDQEHPIAKRLRALIAGDGGDTPREPTPLPDPDILAAFLTHQLVDGRSASWNLDWLDGPVLRDRSGASVPIHEIAAAISETGSVVSLADWLAAR
jgi:hypothetical protein